MYNDTDALASFAAPIPLINRSILLAPSLAAVAVPLAKILAYPLVGALVLFREFMMVKKVLLQYSCFF